MESYDVRLKDLKTGNITDITVTVEEQDGMIVMSSEIADAEFSVKHRDFFTAFLILRDELHETGYRMLCAGAKNNAVQSGMMAGSDRVYLIKDGEDPKPSDAVGIFDYME